MSDRIHPNVTVRNDVECQSDRANSPMLLIVLHDTEGGNVPQSSRDLAGLGAFFDRIETQASSHVATDQDGNSARYVPDARKAWTQFPHYNAIGLSIEQIGFASEDWKSPAKDAQLREAARWIARWSHRHGIPVRRGKVTSDGRVLRTGVVQHRELGPLGGGHHDVSADYPMTRVLRYARQYLKRLNEGK
jgi:hypothetical protein